VVHYRVFGSLVLLIVIQGCVHYDKWSTADKWREAAYLTVHTADWLQTRNANWDEYYETNPILGRSPSTGKTDVYFAATGLLHVAVTHILPSDWRPWWQYISIGFESGVVANNFRIGMGFNF